MARGRKRPVTPVAQAPAPAERPHGRWLRGALGVVLLAAGALRLVCARGDLWLDEIWTLGMLAELKAPLEIVTGLQHDNNHILNSLLSWWLRGWDSDFVLRLPAALLGALGVGCAAWSGALGDGEAKTSLARPGDLARLARALLAALLVGGSYLLVHYGSEARGYAGALAFALLAFALAQRGALEPRSRFSLPYGLATLAALLSHALAVHVVAGVLCWSLVRFWRRGLRGLALVRATLVWHAVPLLGALALYLGFLRKLAIGGGPQESLTPVLARTVGYATGLPLGWGSELLLGLAALAVAGGLWALQQRGADVWVCFLVTLVVSPALLQALQPSELHFERYFVLSAAFGLLLLARLLGLLAARGLEGALVAGLVTAACLGGSAPRIARLMHEQRGQYQAALRFLLEQSPQARVTVSSDHDFRNGLVLRHHAARLGLQQRLIYVPQGSWQGDGPDWFLCHRFEGEAAPAAALQDPAGNRYELRAEYPSAPLSGFRWYVFQRVGRRPPGV